MSATLPKTCNDAARMKTAPYEIVSWGRHWAVYDRSLPELGEDEYSQLLCILVYKKGAVRLIARLKEMGGG